MSNLMWGDYLAIGAYFAAVLGVGLVATYRAKRDSAKGYFLAGQSMTWIPIGASTFATNIGAPMFVGVAGSAAATGIAITMYEWHAMFMLIALGWFFLPVYRAAGCYTMPQYLRMRYGGKRIRIYIACISVFTTIISSIAGQMYAGALFLQKIFEWNLYLSVALILAITALYTIMGGLTAVIWTDTIQTVILIIGASILSIIGLVQVGGWEAMEQSYMLSAANNTYLDVALYGNRTCGLPTEDAFHLFRSASDGNYPWPGMIFGLTILATDAWCTDQVCVQRSLAAKSISHAKGGVLLAAYLKILPFLFFTIPGIISRIFYPEEIACSDPDLCQEICDNPSGCSNIAYPLLVLRILPDGIRGIMLAALLAALMSSLTSVFNSSSTVFTMDIWKQLKPRAKEAELMIVSRIYSIFLVILSIVWLPVLELLQGSQFWDYTQSIKSYIIPPAVTTFIVGLVWPRATEKGAFASLMGSLVVSIIRMGLTWSRQPSKCGSGEEDNQFAFIRDVHYLHFAIILAFIAVVINVAVSLVTQPRPKEKLRRVTIWTKNDPELQELSDSETEEDGDEDDVKKDYQEESQTWKNTCLKYACGIDKTKKIEVLSKAEERQVRLDSSTISEDPYWKKVLDINALICATCAIFLHAFWA